MPELPEAETIARGLRGALLDQAIRDVHVVHSGIVVQPQEAFTAAIRHRVVVAVERRGKNVVLRLDDGSVILINLGMTGSLLPFPSVPPEETAPTHPTLVLHFDSGAVMVFDDTRRFGRAEWLTSRGWTERSALLGPEPLSASFTARTLHAALLASRAPARSWLLDQRRVAGVGNIYANEALFLAGVHPARSARSISAEEASALHRGLRSVLRKAIDQGGTTIRDYRNAEGEPGRYARRLLVYGREGRPCGRCGAPIRRIVFGGRSAFFCPQCQPGTADDAN